MGIKDGCGNSECCASTGIHDDERSRLSGMTFGSGALDNYGYWEFPCGACARAFEKVYPEAIPCWPFEGDLPSVTIQDILPTIFFKEPEMNDISMLRDQYRSLQRSAIQVAPFEYSTKDFNEDCRKELEIREIESTPSNWIVAAEATYRAMIFMADEYDEYLEEKARQSDEDRRQEALERRYDFMKENP